MNNDQSLRLLEIDEKLSISTDMYQVLFWSWLNVDWFLFSYGAKSSPAPVTFWIESIYILYGLSVFALKLIKALDISKVRESKVNLVIKIWKFRFASKFSNVIKEEIDENSEFEIQKFCIKKLHEYISSFYNLLIPSNFKIIIEEFRYVKFSIFETVNKSFRSN